MEDVHTLAAASKGLLLHYQLFVNDLRELAHRCESRTPGAAEFVDSDWLRARERRVWLADQLFNNYATAACEANGINLADFEGGD